MAQCLRPQIRIDLVASMEVLDNRGKPGNVRSFPYADANAPAANSHSFSSPLSGFTVKSLLAGGRYLESQSTTRVLALGTIFVAILGELDIITGAEISFAIFYLIPISFVTWRVGKFAGLVCSFQSAAIWFLADVWAGHSSTTITVAFWNAAVRFGFFMILTYTLSALSLMLQLARTDFLTGLANRRAFYEITDNEIHRSQRSHYSFTLMYVDIDDFKAINDSQGHNIGDSLLRIVGVTLAKSTRRTDTVARLGGDEFAILFPDTTYDSAASAIRNVRDALTAALVTDHPQVTFSVGAATFQTVPATVEAAIEQADQLMYEVKRGGKNSLIHRRVPAPSARAVVQKSS